MISLTLKFQFTWHIWVEYCFATIYIRRFPLSWQLHKLYRSKCMIDRNEFDCSKFWETRNVNISISAMTITVVLSMNCLKNHVVYIQKEIFAITFISMDYISLQAGCQIFVDRSAGFGQLVTCFLVHYFHSDFIYRASHIVLLPVAFMSFRILVI
jgi:hypothetical protein